MSEDIERPLRGRGGCFMLLVPAVLIPVVIGGYMTMFGLGIQGRAPTGDRVVMNYDGCEAAADVVLARVSHMGLGDPVVAERSKQGFSISARMPEDARVAGLIPASLTEIGVFSLHWREGEQIADASDVIEVFPRMTPDASAMTIVKLEEKLGVEIQLRQMEDPAGHITVRVDGVQVVELGNDDAIVNGEVAIDPSSELVRDAIEEAAALAIMVADPLPCAIVLVDTAVLVP